jgi:hypothetical protein
LTGWVHSDHIAGIYDRYDFRLTAFERSGQSAKMGTIENPTFRNEKPRITGFTDYE